MLSAEAAAALRQLWLPPSLAATPSGLSKPCKELRGKGWHQRLEEVIVNGTGMDPPQKDWNSGERKIKSIWNQTSRVNPSRRKMREGNFPHVCFTQIRGSRGWRVSYCFPLVPGIQLGHWRPGFSFPMKQEQDLILFKRISHPPNYFEVRS